MTATDVGELIVYISENPIEDAVIGSVKREFPDAMVYADLLEPLYEAGLPTRIAAQKLGRVKAELETMVRNGVQIVVVCQKRTADLGTRAHFMASLCASADKVHLI